MKPLWLTNRDRNSASTIRLGKFRIEGANSTIMFRLGRLRVCGKINRLPNSISEIEVGKFQVWAVMGSNEGQKRFNGIRVLRIGVSNRST